MVNRLAVTALMAAASAAWASYGDYRGSAEKVGAPGKTKRRAKRRAQRNARRKNR